MDRPSFTIDEQYLICRAINLFGDDQHQWLHPEIVNFDTNLDYIKKCVSLIPNDDLTKEGLVLKQKIMEKIQ